MNICPHCGSKISSDTIFCNNCGIFIANRSQSIIKSETIQKPKTRHKLLIGITIVSIMVILTFIALFLSILANKTTNNIITTSSEISEEGSAYTTVSSFFDNLMEGDIEQAITYCKTNSSAWEKAMSFRIDNQISKIVSSFTNDKEEQVFLEEQLKSNEYVLEMFRLKYRYTIKDYSVMMKETPTTYVVRVSHIVYEDADMFAFADDLFNAYFEKISNYVMKKESEILISLFEATGSDMVKLYEEVLGNSDYEDILYYVSLTETNGGWEITEW